MKRSFADILQDLDDSQARRLARKLPEWTAVSAEVPSALSLEQCSSSATAYYKATVAGQAAAAANLRFAHPSHALRRGPLPFTRPRAATGLPAAPPAPAMTVLDLTGGLGVDSWAFSQVAERVVYFEREATLAEAAKRNFARLGVSNIEVRCETVTAETVLPAADLIYADPARRDAAGRKVFLLEDCSPDILTLLPMLLQKAPTVLLKVSPMADLAMLADRLGPALRELHVVELDGEVKEILCLISSLQAAPAEPEIIVVILSGQAAAAAPPAPEKDIDLPSAVRSEATQGSSRGSAPSFIQSLRFLPLEERETEVKYAAEVRQGDVLLEPSPALLKAGAFRLPCARWGLLKLAPSTHLYLLPKDVARRLSGAKSASADRPAPGLCGSKVGKGLEAAGGFGGYAPVFKARRVREVLPLNNASLKDLKRRYPRADVSARNLPLNSEALQKKLGIPPGGGIHIFGCRLADGTAVLIVAEA